MHFHCLTISVVAARRIANAITQIASLHLAQVARAMYGATETLRLYRPCLEVSVMNCTL